MHEHDVLGEGFHALDIRTCRHRDGQVVPCLGRAWLEADDDAVRSVAERTRHSCLGLIPSLSHGHRRGRGSREGHHRQCQRHAAQGVTRLGRGVHR